MGLIETSSTLLVMPAAHICYIFGTYFWDWFSVCGKKLSQKFFSLAFASISFASYKLLWVRNQKTLIFRALVWGFWSIWLWFGVFDRFYPLALTVQYACVLKRTLLLYLWQLIFRSTVESEVIFVFLEKLTWEELWEELLFQLTQL